jgi:hypothetical protein
MSGPDARGGAALVASVPGLRTFKSRRFHLVIATVLALLGVSLVVKRLVLFDVTDVDVAFDFRAYYYAAERMLAGLSPYTAAQLEGHGGAYCLDCYLYPPFFAQLLSPMTLVPLAAAKMVWLALGYVAAFASTWLATGIGGAARSLEVPSGVSQRCCFSNRWPPRSG